MLIKRNKILITAPTEICYIINIVQLAEMHAILLTSALLYTISIAYTHT